MAEALTPRAREIATTARAILEREGPDALAMRTIADRLGIRAPSLYKHFAGKEALEAAVLSEGFSEVADAFEHAAAASTEPLAALAGAYRVWGKAHPHLYRLMNERPLRRELLAPGVEERAAAAVVAAANGDADLARAAFGFAHGMVILELNTRFPPGADLDAAWAAGIEAFTKAARKERRRTSSTAHPSGIAPRAAGGSDR